MSEQQIQKIIFPYIVKRPSPASPFDRIAVYFGADFYNLPIDSNRELFIKTSNQILDYMRHSLPGFKFVYQPHPNETDEYIHLDLHDFKIEERTIAEIYLHENASVIDYVFSAYSGASTSAFAMGFDSVIFLDLLQGALSEETIAVCRTYFSGLPDFTFIKSWSNPLPRRKPLSPEIGKKSFEEIAHLVNLKKTIWMLASEPAAGLRCAVIARSLKQKQPKLCAKLIIVNHRRWNLGLSNKTIQGAFDEIIQIPGQRIWYGTGFRRILGTYNTARFLKHLPIEYNDNLIFNFANSLEENCLLSYHSKTNKILLIENRWYQFMYGGESEVLPKDGWRSMWGVRFFNYIVEPLLGLHSTIYREFRDGKTLNLFRYNKSPEKIYDHILVLMPSAESHN
ncbi:MAG TPA: hypothetical protein VJH63_01195 [Candidatus Paceibacterota bacterium]